MIWKTLSCLFAVAVVALLVLGCGPTEPPADSPVAEKADEAAAPKIRTPHQYLYVVYFNPAGRKCLPGYRERLDRVMTEVQTWYRDEMERNGFGPMTFPLERDEQGRLIVHVVNGTEPYAYADKIDAEEIVQKWLRSQLLEQGIDISQEHKIVFQNSCLEAVGDDGAVRCIHCWSPYWGGGCRTDGVAWLIDFTLFDPRNLSKKSPAVYSGARRYYPLGHFVVSHMGGTTHELAHAFGLPHNNHTPKQAETLGHTLMGTGHYYLLGEPISGRKRAFLSKAHATILSSHPLFKRNTDDIDVEVDFQFGEVTFTAGEGEYTISGRVEASLRAYTVVAYHDGLKDPKDYDATSWVSLVDEDGRFEVRVESPVPGDFVLRLRCYAVNNDMAELVYRFTLDDSLTIPVADLNRQSLYELYAKPAIEAQDPSALLEAIQKLEGGDDIYLRRATAYHRLISRPASEPRTLISAVDEAAHEIPLSSVAWETAEVGWQEPTRDCAPDEERPARPLESGAQFHDTGLWAHSVSSYVYNLDGQWKQFTSGYGLQNLIEGSVVFVVKCDGKERFRSELVKDWVERQAKVDLTGVKQLELIVEDGRDGDWGDCAVWFSPMLSR